MKFKMMCVLFILSIILSISSVSAVEDNGFVLDEINQNGQNMIEQIDITDDELSNSELVDDVLSDSGMGDDVLSDSGISDDNTLCATQTYSFADLENKINNAVGDNITISGTYTFNTLTDRYYNGIFIRKNNNFTIIGNNLVIDGLGHGSAFNFQMQTGFITLQNITFINCYKKNGNGGAVFSCIPFKIINCTFKNNVADGSGGAVYSELSYSSEYQSAIINSTFTNNRANYDHDAVYWKTVNKDYFENNNFTNHIYGHSIFRFEGNNSTFAVMNFINNTGKICLDLEGNGLYVPAGNSSNNTGISVRIIGNNSMFGGNIYDNSNLNNTDYAIVIIGNKTSVPGVRVYSPKSLECNTSYTSFGGSTFSGDVVCNGYVDAGGLNVYGDLTIEGDSRVYGCNINGTLTANGASNFSGVTVGRDLILNDDSQIYYGNYSRIINNNGNLNITTYENTFDLINNGGFVNLSNYNFTGCNFINNGGKILSQISDMHGTLTDCSFINNGGELKFNITLLNNTNIKNSKGTVNLENCLIDGGKIENYDVLNINDGPMMNGNLVNNKGTANIRNVSYSDNLSIDNKAKLNIQGSKLTNCSLSNSGELLVSNDTKMDGLVIKKVDTSVSAAKVTMKYGASKKITIKITVKSGNPIKNTKFTVTINKKKYIATSNANGVATVKIPVLKVGSYKVTVKGENEYYNIKNIQTTVKVNKAKTTVKMAKSVKKSKKYKITIKSKVTKKAVSKVKIKVKVYTGKKVKTFKVKTNKKGIAKISTKKLAKGKHKIIISSLNKNYKISKKTTFKIK